MCLCSNKADLSFTPNHEPRYETFSYPFVINSFFDSFVYRRGPNQAQTNNESQANAAAAISRTAASFFDPNNSKPNTGTHNKPRCNASDHSQTNRRD